MPDNFYLVALTAYILTLHTCTELKKARQWLYTINHLFIVAVSTCAAPIHTYVNLCMLFWVRTNLAYSRTSWLAFSKQSSV